MNITKREVELIKGMIEVQLNHAARANMMQSSMGNKQYNWDMERVAFLKRLLRENTVVEENDN